MKKYFVASVVYWWLDSTFTFKLWKVTFISLFSLLHWNPVQKVSLISEVETLEVLNCCFYYNSVFVFFKCWNETWRLHFPSDTLSRVFNSFFISLMFMTSSITSITVSTGFHWYSVCTTFVSKLNFSVGSLSRVSTWTRWMSLMLIDPSQKSDVILRSFVWGRTTSSLITSSWCCVHHTPIILLFQPSWSLLNPYAQLSSPAIWERRGGSAALWVRQCTRGLDPHGWQ